MGGSPRGDTEGISVGNTPCASAGHFLQALVTRQLAVHLTFASLSTEGRGCCLSLLLHPERRTLPAQDGVGRAGCKGGAVPPA